MSTARNQASRQLRIPLGFKVLAKVSYNLCIAAYKNRIATPPEKLLTAAKQQSTTPQMIIQAAEYLPKGRRCRRTLVGYSHAR